ncbi:MAG: hypothetical protein KatS3mg059_0897 [Thermomicrobiales bacterium]|nr:MAG: hypothetical protein KatS3mg059_0897 [Thermomicrobiales bacterium]
MTATAPVLTGVRAGNSAPVSFEHVTKRYGDVLAVDDLNLHVENGELMVLPRSIRLRQDDVAAHAGRAGEDHFRGHSHWGYDRQ